MHACWHGNIAREDENLWSGAATARTPKSVHVYRPVQHLLLFLFAARVLLTRPPPTQTSLPSTFLPNPDPDRRLRPKTKHPLYRLWSLYHYRTLLVLYLQIHAHFLFVDILRRGKMFNCYARLLGASVGRDADVATMYFTDHDLVSGLLGDSSGKRQRVNWRCLLYFHVVLLCTTSGVRVATQRVIGQHPRREGTDDAAKYLRAKTPFWVVAGCGRVRCLLPLWRERHGVSCKHPWSNSPLPSPHPPHRPSQRPSGACDRCLSETERWYRKTVSRTRRYVRGVPVHMYIWSMTEQPDGRDNEVLPAQCVGWCWSVVIPLLPSRIGIDDSSGFPAQGFFCVCACFDPLI